MVAEKTAKNFRGLLFLPHPVHNLYPSTKPPCCSTTVQCGRNGVYPLTAFSTAVRAPVANRGTRANTPELVENTNNTEAPEPVEVESRLVIRHSCQIHQLENSQTLQVLCT